MQSRDTDADWTALAVEDPYWAVLSLDRFKAANLTAEHRADFFASGEAFIGWVFDTVRRHVDAEFAPAVALDLGCGVGRLLLPLARRCREAVGLDVAAGMLAEARRLADAAGLTNIRLARADDTLSEAGGPFDLITSYIVFQHIPPARGQQIARALVACLRDGGVGVLHVTYSKTYYGDQHHHVAWPPDGRFEPQPPGVINSLASLARAGRGWVRKRFASRAIEPSGPQILMHPYTLNPLLHTLQAAGVRQIYVELTDHGGDYGAVLFFRKTPAEGYRA